MKGIQATLWAQPRLILIDSAASAVQSFQHILGTVVHAVIFEFLNIKHILSSFKICYSLRGPVPESSGHYYFKISS